MSWKKLGEILLRFEWSFNFNIQGRLNESGTSAHGIEIGGSNKESGEDNMNEWDQYLIERGMEIFWSSRIERQPILTTPIHPGDSDDFRTLVHLKVWAKFTTWSQVRDILTSYTFLSILISISIWIRNIQLGIIYKQYLSVSLGTRKHLNYPVVVHSNWQPLLYWL